MDLLIHFINIVLPRNFDYNTQIVLVGIIIYNIGCSLIGNFLLLQKRSLLADVLSHATLPGVIGCFVIMLVLGYVALSKNIFMLTGGALLSSFIAVLAMMIMQRYSILKPDAIQAIILSVFFGAGVALLGLAQRIPTGSTAGMMMYIYGNTASMQIEDMYMFIIITFLIVITVLRYRRTLTITCFDSEYASSIGINPSRLDLFFLFLILLQVVIGIQAIGILMVSAMFIIPVVVARFWTQTLHALILISIVVGMVSGYVGALLSANSEQYPTGAVIVAVMEVIFIFSVFLGTQKGILIKLLDRISFNTKMRTEHILRLLYEYTEGNIHTSVNISEILELTGSPKVKVLMLLQYMEFKKLVVKMGDVVTLTYSGEHEAIRVLRNHRLWEAYLLYFTDATPESVDYSADKVEHILGEELTNSLVKIVANNMEYNNLDPIILPSPHAIKQKAIKQKPLTDTIKK